MHKTSKLWKLKFILLLLLLIGLSKQVADPTTVKNKILVNIILYSE